MTNDILLTASDLHFAYTDTPLIRSVDLAVTGGQVSCIVGPNGAGKTTLIRLLAGILRPHCGSIVFREKDIQRYYRRELGKELALIPSEVFAPFAYSVREVVEMGRYVHWGDFASRGDADRSAIAMALERTKMTSFAEQPFNTLSSGERQRAVIARSLAQEPVCLLMDEPTAHLDLHYQIEIHELLRSLARERGTGVLFISHDLNLAARFSDEMILMDGGKIVARGAPREIMNEALLSVTYRTPLEVVRHPRTGQNLVWPRSDQPLQ